MKTTWGKILTTGIFQRFPILKNISIIFLVVATFFRVLQPPVSTSSSLSLSSPQYNDEEDNTLHME